MVLDTIMSPPQVLQVRVVAVLYFRVWLGLVLTVATVTGNGAGTAGMGLTRAWDLRMR
jgi:hypothetical protein